MARLDRSFAAGAAMLAALSLGTPQAFALDLPVPGNAAAETLGVVEEAQDYHRHRRYDRRGGIDAGDVIAGVVIIGAIAAIANASNSNRDRRQERVEDYPRRDNVRYRDNREDQRFDSRGIDRAVDMCVEQVERGNTRIDSVDNAARVADGWRVSGALSGGESWNCWIDNDGRVRSVDFGTGYSASLDSSSRPMTARNSVRFDSAAAAGEGQEQWSDAAYANARAGPGAGSPLGQSRAPEAEVDADLRVREEALRAGEPAYPGGPVDGQEYPGGEWVDDGRYTSANTGAETGVTYKRS